MKKAIPIILLFVCSSATAYGSTDPHYDSAFAEMKAMLEGKIPLSFKRAVFITENAYIDNQLSYENFNNEIRVLKILAMSIIKNDVLIYDSPDKEIIEKSGAIYKVLKGETEFVIRHDTTISTFKWTPYEYDMNDFWGRKNWINNFVTKALVTHSGNCHSLPLLYKILAEELDVPAYLSIAPNHTYIKQWSDKTGWYNTELTNGSFPYDKDIKWNSYIKTEAIANGIYMDTLSNKQSIAYAITDLAQGYVRKYGHEDSQTPLNWLNTALDYYPNYVNALILRAELQKRQFEKQMSAQGHTKLGEALQVPALAEAVSQLGKSYYHIYQLGYRRMPKEMYLNWLFRVKNDSTREPHTFKTPQPFKDYGYKVHVATAGNGENYEFYDQDTTTRIGTVEINRLTGEIVRFVSYNFEDEMPDEVISRMYDPALGRFWQVDPLAEKRNWLSPYNFVQNNPILRVDPDGALDDYYDTQGNYLGNDGQGDDIRLVREGQEQTVSSKLKGAQTTEADRNAVRGTDNSAVIQIDESAKTMLQTISDHTVHDGVEHQALILLDIYSDQPRILAAERESGSNSETEMNTVIDNGKRYDSQTGFLVIGQAHGHPLTNDPNKVNFPGTSSQDQATATSTGVPIYSIDSYQGGVGSSQNINRANPYPAKRNQFQTLGIGRSGQTNIGRDALEIHGKKRSN